MSNAMTSATETTANELTTRPMKVLTLGSGANSEFVCWLEFAYTFVKTLEASSLNGEEKTVVKRVLNMKEVTR